jgi:hypothetical protein
MSDSLGYSKKGWTDGEIGAEWIKHFDEQTKRKAEGKWRLLLVDSHNSHYTQEFLVYAVEHRIHVLCYPAHGTHIYQGLDVVIFAVLKLYWTEAKAKWEREKGVKMDKTNFLEIYGTAHLRALTPESICMAFRKTGVFPFDPTVVTKEMMAPSLETSIRGHLPIMPSTPIRAITDLLYRYNAKRRQERDTGGNLAAMSQTVPQRMIHRCIKNLDTPHTCDLPQTR